MLGNTASQNCFLATTKTSIKPAIRVTLWWGGILSGIYYKLSISFEEMHCMVLVLSTNISDSYFTT